MPVFDVALLRERNVHLVVVPVAKTFAEQGRIDQQRTIDQIASAAEAARLPGVVIPVWDKGDGRLGFRAPLALHSYLRSRSIAEITASATARLRW